MEVVLHRETEPAFVNLATTAATVIKNAQYIYVMK